jgi:hypothetical protein
MSNFRVGAAAPLVLSLSALVMPLAAEADTDACTLLTAQQVGAAVGVAVSAGTHVTLPL